MADASGSFAEVLRHAICQRGLGLERIRERLADRGVAVSVATLSYWQSGRSRPERKQSLAAIPHLEEVLCLPDGALRRTLPPPRERGRRSPVQELTALWPEPPHVRVLAQLDTSWDAEIERISLQESLTVGADRRYATMVVRQVLRARRDGPDRLVVMHSQDDPVAELPRILPRQGVRLGPTPSDPRGAVGAELVLERPLRRGETAVVEYEVVAGSPGPGDHEVNRRFRLPLRHYLLQVRFDPAALPAGCEAIRSEEDPVALELDFEHRVHLVGLDCTGIVGIRWRWPGRACDCGRVNC